MSRPNASSDLIWNVIKKHNNSFLVKRAGAVWSMEPGNLTGKHSHRSSGLCDDKIVDIYLQKRRVQVAVKSVKNSRRNHPAKQFTTAQVSSHPASCNKSVSGIMKAYKPADTKRALRRASALNKIARRNVRKWSKKNKAAKAKSAKK